MQPLNCFFRKFINAQRFVWDDKNPDSFRPGPSWNEDLGDKKTAGKGKKAPGLPRHAWNENLEDGNKRRSSRGEKIPSKVPKKIVGDALNRLKRSAAWFDDIEDGEPKNKKPEQPPKSFPPDASWNEEL